MPSATTSLIGRSSLEASSLLTGFGTVKRERRGAGREKRLLFGGVARLSGHVDVAFVDVDALAVEPGAEGEVADYDEEYSSDYRRGDNGGDVGMICGRVGVCVCAAVA